MSCDWEWGSLAHSHFAAHWCWAYHCNHFSFNFWTKALRVHLVGPDFGQREAEGELWWRSTFRPFFWSSLSLQSSSFLCFFFYSHTTGLKNKLFAVQNDHEVSCLGVWSKPLIRRWFVSLLRFIITTQSLKLWFLWRAKGANRFMTKQTKLSNHCFSSLCVWNLTMAFHLNSSHIKVNDRLVKLPI